MMHPECRTERWLLTAKNSPLLYQKTYLTISWLVPGPCDSINESASIILQAFLQANPTHKTPTRDCVVWTMV
jgi:hypothetical protein